MALSESHMDLPDGIRIQNGSYEVKTRKGWTKKTNFTLTLEGEVQHPSDTMYFARVRREDGVESTGSFAIGDCYKGRDLATALNQTTKDGGHMCMLKNEDLSDLIQTLIAAMKRNNPIYRKELVRTAGLQKGSSTMVINRSTVIDTVTGQLGSIDDTPYVWMGKFSPRSEMERFIEGPTSLQPLTDFLDEAILCLGEEVFGVACMAWSAMYGLNMYCWQIECLRHFNLPVLFGDPMVGKTLIAFCGAWLNGCPRTAVASRCTLPYVTAMVTGSSMPFVWDDPSTPDEVSQLAVDLGNSAVRGKIDVETRMPITGCLVTANFNLSDMMKYFSRIVLLYVKSSKKKKEAGGARKLEEKAKAASASFPAVMQQLLKLDADEVFEEVKTLKLDADIRILEGIAFNLLICRQVLTLADRPDYMLHVTGYLDSVIGPYYRSILSSRTETVPAVVEDRSSFLRNVRMDKVSSESMFIIKSGTVLAISPDLFNNNPTYVQKNKATKVRGKTRKMCHVRVDDIDKDSWTELMRLLSENTPEAETPGISLANATSAALITLTEEASTPSAEEVLISNEKVSTPSAEEILTPPTEEVLMTEEAAENSSTQPAEEVILSTKEVSPHAVETDINSSAKRRRVTERELNDMAKFSTAIAESKNVAIHLQTLQQTEKDSREECGVCLKTGRKTQTWVECEVCKQWFHCACKKVSRSEYVRIERGDENWKCSKNCKQV